MQLNGNVGRVGRVVGTSRPYARFSSSWHKSFLFYEICIADRAHKVLGVVPKMGVCVQWCACMHM
jgi:hypothetical protein